jgi:Family of unknown function (DUF5994)
MAPVGSQDVKITPAEAPQAAADEGQRLTLDPALPQRGGISGGWWPRSRDAGAELPAMLTELSPLAGRVSRVAVQVDAFGNIPHQLIVGGRKVHVAWFRAMDPHTVSLTLAGRDRLTLLVVPPQAAPASGAEALRLAADGHSSRRPEEILAAAGVESGYRQAPAPPLKMTG